MTSHITNTPYRLSWIQLGIQTIVIISSFVLYAVSQEHRITVIEETIKSQIAIQQQLSSNQSRIIDNMNELKQNQAVMRSLLEAFNKNNQGQR